MRIAVIGSGISGLASAWLLSREHEIVLFEAADYLGGHTHTHAIEAQGRRHAIDTGFIVHNPAHYPLLTRFFAELGVASQATTMSFSVQNAASGLEYNATSLDALFCQRRNLLSPRFLGMLRDLMRFYRIAPQLLATDDDQTLEEFLAAHDLGAAFRDEHLVPMASALWSSPPSQILAFPARYLVQFMANHCMLQITGRPDWRVVCGGSRRYVEALCARWPVQVRLSTPVLRVRREAAAVEIETAVGRERFDQAILACHSDDALAMLTDADERERDILGAITFQTNDTVLHTDTALLPHSRKAWAAWNAYIPQEAGAACTVSYCMNLLQRIDADETYVVTLNRTDRIDPDRILRRMSYRHPVYTRAAVAAQKRRTEIQGRRNTWFAGAYWGWGFHEDGIRSGAGIAQALGVRWPSAKIALAPPVEAVEWSAA